MSAGNALPASARFSPVWRIPNDEYNIQAGRCGPACWPAYAGIVSALGLGFLVSAKYLLPLTALFLALTAFALGFRASLRHGYGPFWVGLLAAAVILTGKFYFDAEK